MQPQFVINNTFKHFGINADMFYSDNKTEPVVIVKHITRYILYWHLKKTFREVARISLCDHKTVFESSRLTLDLMLCNEKYRIVINNIIAHLNQIRLTNQSPLICQL